MKDYSGHSVFTIVLSYALALVSAIVAVGMWAGHLVPTYRFGYFVVTTAGIQVLALTFLTITLKFNGTEWDKGFQRFGVAMIFLTSATLATGLAMILATPVPTWLVYEPVANFLLMLFAIRFLWYIPPVQKDETTPTQQHRGVGSG